MKKQVEKTEKDNKVVSVDLGIRSFMTCLSESEVIKIGNNSIDTIKPYLAKINKLNTSHKQKKKILSKREKKIEKRCYRKIKNKVTDLHWKTINYLTSKYNVILIGDLSIKGVSKKDTSVLGKMMKRIGYHLSFYKFRQRIEYKSISRGNHLIIVNESYTSKTCSKCGYYNDTLGDKKIFECPECKIKMDRDVNGCRGIYMKCTK
jgi:putative transposase